MHLWIAQWKFEKKEILISSLLSFSCCRTRLHSLFCLAEEGFGFTLNFNHLLLRIGTHIHSCYIHVSLWYWKNFKGNTLLVLQMKLFVTKSTTLSWNLVMISSSKNFKNYFDALHTFPPPNPPTHPIPVSGNNQSTLPINLLFIGGVFVLI